MTTLAPSLAKHWTAARPMPRDPPVTSATRFFKLKEVIKDGDDSSVVSFKQFVAFD
jgi:hypothetical protein